MFNKIGLTISIALILSGITLPITLPMYWVAVAVATIWAGKGVYDDWWRERILGLIEEYGMSDRFESETERLAAHLSQMIEDELNNEDNED